METGTSIGLQTVVTIFAFSMIFVALVFFMPYFQALILNLLINIVRSGPLA